jgi:hypothetical protein
MSEVDQLPDGTTISTTYAPDPRYGMLAPTATTITALPGNGPSRTVAVARSGGAPGQPWCSYRIDCW